MKLYRLIGVALAAAIMFTGRPLVGRSEQGAAAPPGGQPFDTLHFRPIGPASMSGRITDLAVYETNPALYYVATAHGGVWKTSNNGTTFEAIFQDQGRSRSATSRSRSRTPIFSGSAAANRATARACRGETASTSRPTAARRSRTWDSAPPKRINRIVIDPSDNNIVFVAVTGSLWGPGSERGIYKTVDGGKTWKQTLKVDDDTGANEVAMDPSNSQILYATMYQRRRTQCCFNGGGAGSGIFKSTDGGETWTKLKGGVLDGELGRIAHRRLPQAAEHPLRAHRRSDAADGGRGGRGAGPAGEEGPGGARRGAAGSAGGGRGAAVARSTIHRPACIAQMMRERRGGR